MIIGVAGAKSSGKDTVGQHLVYEHGFTQAAFADKLKDAACVLLGMNRDQIERYKNNKEMEVGVFLHSGFNMGGHIKAHQFRKPVSIRHFLQLMGTEMGRNIFGEDFWLNQLLPHLNPEGYAFSKHYPEHLVITDVRFHNECKRIHDLGGKVIHLTRIGASVDTHQSENYELDVDISIANDDTKEALYKGVDAILNAWILEHA